MRELTPAEMQQVHGGITTLEGAQLIAGLSMWSPVTMAFGGPIAASLLFVHVVTS